MTIRPGQDWGDVVPAPDDLLAVADDAAFAAMVRAGNHRPVRVSGGDLLGAVGGPSSDGTDVRRFTIDVLHVLADGVPMAAVAHVLARRLWWRGRVVAVMNVDHLGRWDVAPRAHPNDGRVDVVEVDRTMGVRARWQAWRRLPTGTHVPHPLLHTRRVRQDSWTFNRPMRLWVDGVARGTVRSLRVTVEPDGATVHA